MSLQQVLAEVLSLRAEIASLKAMMGEGSFSSKGSVVSNASSNTPGKDGKRKKRTVKKDENGKAILTPWTKFTKRVSSIMKEAGKPNGVESVSFASQLKQARKEYETYTDDEIKEALKGFVAPVIVKKGGKKSKKDTTPAASISSPGDDEESVVTTSNVVSTSSIVKREELDFGGDSDDESEGEEAEEDIPIVFKGKKYFKNSKTGACYQRLPEDVKGDYVGMFIEKDPETGKPKLDTAAPEPTA